MGIFKSRKEKSPDWYRKHEFEIKEKPKDKPTMILVSAGGDYDYDLYRKGKKIAKIYLRWKHSCWGNAITIEWEKQSGHGFLFDKPDEGDLLFIRLQKGGIAVMSFTELDYCDDPKDMFFFKMLEVGYFGKQFKVNMSKDINKEITTKNQQISTAV